MSKEFVAWCQELLAPLGAVRTRRMFGGWGLYVDELFIALIAHERLYLKVDEHSKAAFEAAGASAFEYHTAGGERGVMNYFNAPDEAMDAPVQMAPWARLAMDAALRARASKPASKPRAATTTARNTTARKVATRKPAPRKVIARDA